MLVSEV